jgi:23S rRNA (cytidine1920-2'-O)/16S rRNA (cytidine1409-2'-O)-methyltransferase
MRIDKLLFTLGLFESRKKAQVAVQKGLVSLRRNGGVIKVKKVSEDFQEQAGDEWIIEPDDEFKYVSRSGQKLEGALKEFKKSVQGLVCLDIGISTGGFTDCLLNHGAAFVLGIDVGHDQLHPRLREQSRLRFFDKINAREPLNSEITSVLPGPLDLIVADVSFISVVKVITPQLPLLTADGEVLLLLKPQFEVGKGQLGKKGIVARPDGLIVLGKTVTLLESLGLHILGTSESILAGEDGNQEFFIYCRNRPSGAPFRM